MKRGDWFRLAGMVLIFSGFFALYGYYGGIAGRVIEVPGESFGGVSPDNGFEVKPPEESRPGPSGPSFSPPTETECSKTKTKRDALCEAYTDNFPDGCGFFDFFRGCRLFKRICENAQETVENLCSLG